MNQLIYEDKEVQCFCFQSPKNQTPIQFRSSSNLNPNTKDPKYLRPIRSVESKGKNQQNSRNKKSLKREKQKTPTRSTYKQKQCETEKKINFIEENQKLSSLYQNPQPKSINTFQNKPLISILPQRKQEYQCKIEKKIKIRNPHQKITFQPIKFDSNVSSYPQNQLTFPHIEINQPTFPLNSQNFLNIKSQEKQLQKECFPLKNDHGSKKIYPKEIQSMIDENDYEDEISQVQWGWTTFQKNQLNKKTGKFGLETLQTMSSQIKNSEIKNSLSTQNQQMKV